MTRQTPALMLDEYELTMADAYLRTPHMAERKATFSLFFRRVPDGGAYAVCAGIEQAIRYLENLRFSEDEIAYLADQRRYSDEFLAWLADFRFEGEVDYVPEGTVVYPHTPIMNVTATLPTAQIVETALLTQLNHQCLIATKAARITRAADGRAVSDFCARRVHGADAAIFGARAAYIAGVGSTATVEAGREFGIPITGTFAHSWVMAFDSELEAFMTFARLHPHRTTLLIDTYDVEKGCRNAIHTFDAMREELGDDFGPYGVRIDSGDLAALSRKVRRMLDDAGHANAKIVLSNSLDEHTIQSLIAQGAAVDAFGVGERLGTAKSDPVFGCVYKLCEIEGADGRPRPVIKVSANVEKITNPGRAHLWRTTLVETGETVDIVGRKLNAAGAPRIRVVDPRRPWRLLHAYMGPIEPLHETVRIERPQIGTTDAPHVELPSLDEVRERCSEQLAGLADGELRFENAQEHLVVMLPEYYAEKMEMLAQTGGAPCA